MQILFTGLQTVWEFSSVYNKSFTQTSDLPPNGDREWGFFFGYQHFLWEVAWEERKSHGYRPCGKFPMRPGVPWTLLFCQPPHQGWALSLETPQSLPALWVSSSHKDWGGSSDEIPVLLLTFTFTPQSRACLWDSKPNSQVAFIAISQCGSTHSIQQKSSWDLACEQHPCLQSSNGTSFLCFCSVG